MSHSAQHQDVIHFWFEAHNYTDWFSKNDTFDRTIKDRFLNTYLAAVKGELYTWRETAEGRVAEIIVLDQFSRNMFRDDERAFSHDSMALTLAQEAVAQGIDKKLDTVKRWFLYLPYMHSESLAIHDEAVRLFTQLGMDDVLEYEFKHKHIIERFGRYPHRNKVLGRHSTPEEQTFLKESESSF